MWYKYICINQCSKTSSSLISSVLKPTMFGTFRMSSEQQRRPNICLEKEDRLVREGYQQAFLDHSASEKASGYILDCICSCTTHKAQHNTGSECDIFIDIDTNGYPTNSRRLYLYQQNQYGRIFKKSNICHTHWASIVKAHSITSGVL